MSDRSRSRMPTRSTHSFAPLAALALAFAFAAPAEELRFAPRRGLVLDKRIEIEEELALESMRMLVDGEPAETADMVDESTRKVVLEARDTYVDPGERWVRELRRTYRGVSGAATRAVTFDGGTSERDDPITSPLTGRTVRFVWSDEENAYSAKNVGESEPLSDQVLAGLDADLDFAFLVPSGPVEVGAQWRLPPRAVWSLLHTGGDLSLRYLSYVGYDRERGARLAESARGELVATFRGVQEADGRRVALISIAGELTARDEAEVVDVAHQTKTARVRYALEGELLWDLGASHLHSLELGADVRETYADVSRYGDAPEDGGGAGDVEVHEQELVYAGRRTWTLRYRPAD